MKTFLNTKTDFQRTFYFLFERGFFHIVSANILNKCIMFGTSIFLVKILSKSDYGIWTYSFNIISFFMLLGGLGVDNGIIYYGTLTDDKEKKRAYLKFGLIYGTLFNIIIALIIFLGIYIYDFPIKNSQIILEYLSFLPAFITVVSIFMGYFRSDFKNKQFSLLSLINSALLFICILIGSLYSLKGVVLGHYVAYALTIIIAIVFCRSFWNSSETKYTLPKDFKLEFLKYSFTCSLTNAVSSVLYILDVFLVGLILKDTNTLASYKTATLIPFGLNFIPLSIMIFCGPYFTKMSQNYKDLRYYYMKLKRSLFILNFFICIGLYLLAPYIINIFFGEDYIDSITIFKVLVIGYFIAGTFRIPNGNLIASIGKSEIKLICCYYQ